MMPKAIDEKRVVEVSQAGTLHRARDLDARANIASKSLSRFTRKGDGMSHMPRESAGAEPVPQSG